MQRVDLPSLDSRYAAVVLSRLAGEVGIERV
jgi:hypothetical protein